MRGFKNTTKTHYMTGGEVASPSKAPSKGAPQARTAPSMVPSKGVPQARTAPSKAPATGPSTSLRGVPPKAPSKGAPSMVPSKAALQTSIAMQPKKTAPKAPSTPANVPAMAAKLLGVPPKAPSQTSPVRSTPPTAKPMSKIMVHPKPVIPTKAPATGPSTSLRGVPPPNPVGMKKGGGVGRGALSGLSFMPKGKKC